MKQIFNIVSITLAFFLIGAVLPKSKYILSNDYVVTINGTSNLHDWEEKVQSVSGDCVVNWNEDGSFNLMSLAIKMDVYSIKSKKGKVMDNNTYKALKAETYPKINFSIVSPVKSIQLNSNNKAMDVKGNLTIAGITKSVIIKAEMVMLDSHKLVFKGTEVINMIDYSVNPPTALLGTIKTGNEITISFNTSFVSTTN
jgi:YceI-like domain